MKRVLSVISLFFVFASTANAGGWTEWAVPSQVDMIRNEGFVMFGDFGNPADCTFSGRVFVPSSHPEYEKLYSMALTAFTAGKQIRLYSHGCQPIGWYTTTDKTFVALQSNGAMNIRN